MYTKKNYNKDINTIIPVGFKRIKTYCMFQRDRHNYMETIYYSHRDYFPGGFYMEGVSIDVIFPEVESVLNDILNKYSIPQHYGNSTIHSALNNIEGIDYSKFETKIHDEASFQIVAEEIKKIVEYGAMPFFEKYGTLEAVFKETEQMSIEQMVHFIEQPLPQRRMVIKKLCNDPKYDEYAKSLIDYYKSEKDPDLFFIEKLNEFLNEKFG